MDLFLITLILAAFLCSLVAGFLFAFAVVVMPGIRDLHDRSFIRAFQVMDGIIQNNQPLFLLVWLGSAIATLVLAVLGIGNLDSDGYVLVIITVLLYILGVQLPTVVINLPLNKRLQALDVDALELPELETARRGFEAAWNRANVFRTLMACLVSLLLLALLLRY